MTVGIAAACHENDAPRLVVCADTMVSTATASSETEFKLEVLAPHSLFATFAGPSIPEARELVSIYREHGLPDGLFHADALQERFRAPLAIRKKRMVERLVQRRSGLTYDQLLSRRGNDTDFMRRLLGDIDNLTIETELLLFGFAEGGSRIEPFIYQVAWEDVFFQRAFACIGQGAESATQTLHRRKQSPSLPVEHTVYNVYEAKRLAEGAATVGSATMIAIIEPQAGTSAPIIKGLSIDGWKFYGECYDRYGPKPITEISAPSEIELFEQARTKKKEAT